MAFLKDQVAAKREKGMDSKACVCVFMDAHAHIDKYVCVCACITMKKDERVGNYQVFDVCSRSASLHSPE